MVYGVINYKEKYRFDAFVGSNTQDFLDWFYTNFPHAY